MKSSSSSALALALGLILSFAGCAAETPSDADTGVDAARPDGGGVDAARACTDAAACSDGLFCNGEETCSAAGVCTPGTAPHCDDGIACTEDRCVESTRACASAPPDHDHDGFGDAACHDASGVALGTDCDDNDATRFPGGTEVCDAAGHDEDCNPATYGHVDMDGDGHDAATCCNASVCGDDCDDANLNVHPSAAEVCNGIDDDCDSSLDEGLPVLAYRPDCDLDGYGDDAATAMMSCTVPATGPSCAGGVWVTIGGDCADMDPGRNSGNPEVCNDIDDDCNTLVDDIIHGTVICRAGQTRACHNASCGVDGLETCADTCLGFDGRCLATEICNGCDDDGDGADDNGFACAQGTSAACTVPVCGTAGTEVCTATCALGTCTAPEACNYCDDNASGNFFEERPLATVTSNFSLANCAGGAYSLFGSETACGTTPTGMGFDLWATLLDGTANDESGAMWFDPSGWVQGWGPTDITVDLEVTAVTAGGGAEQPLGGWAVIVGHGGTLGVGTPHNRGIPTTVDGVAASWYWSTYDSCYAPAMPPSSGDSVRFTPIRGGSIGNVRAQATAMDSGCFSGDGIEGAATDFDGVATGTTTERIQLRYTPDDPTTAAINEEQVRIIASTPGVGGAITYLYTPSNDMPIGTAPLRIGITAGTFTQSGFSGPPSSLVFGVPVRARAHIFNQTMNCCGRPPTFTYSIQTTRTGICP